MPRWLPFRPFARISLRLLLFNVLLVFVPVAGFLYLHVYERQLLEAQERSMVQQGRLVAAALEAQGSLTAEGAARLLAALDRETEARLRVYAHPSPSGAAAGSEEGLLADSARLGPREAPAAAESAGDYRSTAPPATRQRLLYRLGAGIYRAYRSVREPGPAARPAPVRSDGADPGPGAAVRKALAGQYGALSLPNPDPLRPSLMLHSALPVEIGGRTAGAVLVSQSTVKVLRALDEVRLEIFQVVLISLAVALLVSLFLAGTIARPLRRLAGEARDLLDRQGRLHAAFRGSDRADEIGDLARALEELTHRIAGYQRTLEGFAADLSHEMKNPLASIRSATEVLADLGGARDEAERSRFLGIVEREVARLERLLTDVRRMGEVDAGLEPEPEAPLDLRQVLGEAVEGAGLRAGRGVRFALRTPQWPVMVHGSPTRLGQALGNLLDNAESFSPAGGEVEVALAVEGNERAVIRIADRGPGIPAGNLDRLFDRFFSYRPNEARSRERHTGLGLSIVKSIVEANGGTVTARNREGGGAAFEVRLGMG